MFDVFQPCLFVLHKQIGINITNSKLADSTLTSSALHLFTFDDIVREIFVDGGAILRANILLKDWNSQTSDLIIPSQIEILNAEHCSAM